MELPQFFTEAASFYISVKSAQESQFFHILIYTYYFLLYFLKIAILMGVKHLMISMDFSLMISYAEHVFIFLSAICIFLEKMCVQIFSHI